VAVAVNAALRDARIEIAFPQRIVHLAQNDNASKHSLGEQRANAGGNLPRRGSENLTDTANASPSPGKRSQSSSTWIIVKSFHRRSRQAVWRGRKRFAFPRGGGDAAPLGGTVCLLGML